MKLEFNSQYYPLFNPIPSLPTPQYPLFDDTNNSELFEGCLTNFIQELKKCFSVENDITIEFAQLHLSLSEVCKCILT